MPNYALALPLLFAILAAHTTMQQVPESYAQQGGIISEKAERGSEEISEYYNVNDVKLAMAIIAAALGGVLLYLARDIILRRKSEYEKKEYASKHDRDYEKYHSEWNAYDDDFFGPRKRKGAEEFRKMVQDSSLPDYYGVLGVAQDAGPEEIKKRYRYLVKKYHPDRTRSEKTAEKFAEITNAYEVLSDEKTRKSYDSYYGRSGA